MVGFINAIIIILRAGVQSVTVNPKVCNWLDIWCEPVAYQYTLPTLSIQNISKYNYYNSCLLKLSNYLLIFHVEMLLMLIVHRSYTVQIALPPQLEYCVLHRFDGHFRPSVDSVFGFDRRNRHKRPSHSSESREV